MGVISNWIESESKCPVAEGLYNLGKMVIPTLCLIALLYPAAPAATQGSGTCCQENQRVECGFPGITPDQCAAKGCCFDNKGHHWCSEKTCGPPTPPPPPPSPKPPPPPPANYSVRAHEGHTQPRFMPHSTLTRVSTCAFLSNLAFLKYKHSIYHHSTTLHHRAFVTN